MAYKFNILGGEYSPT